MKRSLLARLWRHSAFAFTRIVLFGIATAVPIGNLVEVGRLSAAGDPVEIADWNVDRILTSGVAEAQIDSALNKGEAEVADGFVALAAEHNVFVPPALIAKVRQAVVDHNAIATDTTQFTRGFLMGEAGNAVSFAGALAGDYTVYGDIRDFGWEGFNCLTGRSCDPLVLSLAGGGIVLTVASFGLSAPEHTGLSLIKFARRDGRLNPSLLWRLGRSLLNPADSGAFGEFAGNLTSIGERAGIETALDTVSLIEAPEEAALIARLALAKGKKTRAILRLLGRNTFRLGIQELRNREVVPLGRDRLPRFLCVM